MPVSSAPPVAPAALPELRVRSVHPALVKQGTVTELLAIQDSLLRDQEPVHRQQQQRLAQLRRSMAAPSLPAAAGESTNEQDESACKDEGLGALVAKSDDPTSPANISSSAQKWSAALKAQVSASAGGSAAGFLDILRELRNTRLTDGGGTQNSHHYPFLHLMYVAQVDQCCERSLILWMLHQCLFVGAVTARLRAGLVAALPLLSADCYDADSVLLLAAVLTAAT